MVADVLPSYADVLATLTNPQHNAWASPGGLDDQDIGLQSLIFRTMVVQSGFSVSSFVKRPGELGFYNELLRIAGPAVDSTDGSRIPLFLPGRQARYFVQDTVLVNNTETLANTGLGEYIAQGRQYIFWGMIAYRADASAGMRLAWGLPSGAVSFHCVVGMNSTATDDDGPATIRFRTSTNAAPLTGLGTSVTAGSLIFGIGQGGSSGTNAHALQAAQLTAHASDLTIMTGSWLEVQVY